MKPRLRPWLEGVAPYVPGRPAAQGPGSLASNEPALSSSETVASALVEAIPDIHRYPDPLADRVRQHLALELGVDEDQILVGDGSDELIFLLVLAYAAMGGTITTADPAYRIHTLAPALLGAEVRLVALRNWVHDLEAMAEVESDITFICNPHNPTGTAVGLDALGSFVSHNRSALVVVDEAYVDFADDPAAISAMRLAASGEVVVLRTMSKLYGLAGLRLGYLVGPPGVVGDLRRIRMPFSVGTLSQAGALAAVKDRRRAEEVREYTLAARAQMVVALEKAGLACVPSQANFVLALTPDEQGFLAHLATRGISVRPGSLLGVPGSVRISVPSPEGMQLLLSALESL